MKDVRVFRVFFSCQNIDTNLRRHVQNFKRAAFVYFQINGMRPNSDAATLLKSLRRYI